MSRLTGAGRGLSALPSRCPAPARGGARRRQPSTGRAARGGLRGNGGTGGPGPGPGAEAGTGEPGPRLMAARDRDAISWYQKKVSAARRARARARPPPQPGLLAGRGLRPADMGESHRADRDEGNGGGPLAVRGAGGGCVGGGER